VNIDHDFPFNTPVINIPARWKTFFKP